MSDKASYQNIDDDGAQNPYAPMMSSSQQPQSQQPPLLQQPVSYASVPVSSQAPATANNSLAFSISAANTDNAADAERLTFSSVDTDTLVTTTHTSSDAIFERLAFQAEDILNRVWAEFFGLIRLLAMVVVTFVRQSLRFSGWLTKSTVLLALLVFGDHVFRPLLFTLYESLLRPVFVCQLAINRAVLVVIQPLIEIVNQAVRPLVAIIGAFRLVDVNTHRPASNV